MSKKVKEKQSRHELHGYIVDGKFVSLEEFKLLPKRVRRNKNANR